MVEASISLNTVKRHGKRIFAVREDVNNAYIVLRDEVGVPLDLDGKIPRIRLYGEYRVVKRDLEVVDSNNGICRLVIDDLEEGIYIAKIEVGSKFIEEFLVVVQE